ncbi:hypothetical protein BJF85_24490 [Saccharomonospora sp. CUA-673]|uniref:DNA-3-methyladenine glycosylase family protein n=1 Tax=Saccharomonospora sp. CUA-673 TaxID=1904969 RepID=UPI000960877C|nr:DNA-3-methyladenine glycosylase [Saccharomonospora sp. CUA-673]OLT41181.1 hypothetical protein BJF85_24490 [Saccharomonospora sp. CUA-673]
MTRIEWIDPAPAESVTPPGSMPVGGTLLGITPRPDAEARRLEPVSGRTFDLTASGRTAGVVNPVATGSSPEPDELWPAFLLDDTWEPVGLRVRRRSQAMVEFRASGPVDGLDRVVAQARRILSLDADHAAFAQVADLDPWLRLLLREAPGRRPVLFGSPYEAACWAIVCQGLNTAQAVRVFTRLTARHGRTVWVAGRERAVLPPPGELRAVSAATRMSAEKRRRLAVVAEAAESGLLDATALRAMEAADALRLLRQLPGIGPYSAELVLARGAGHPDVFPAHDRHLVRLVEDVYREPAEQAAEGWAPYRSWASFLLRVALPRGERWWGLTPGVDTRCGEVSPCRTASTT